jgi:hypothetical protein
MSLARNLSKFKPSSSGLVETADIADGAITNVKVNDSAGIVATKLGTMATANMPNGSVIQFVSTQSHSNHFTNSTSVVAITDLKVTITPTESGNKIVYNLHGGHISYLTGACRLFLWLYIKVGSGTIGNAHPSGGTNRWLECETSSTFGVPNSMQFVYTSTGTDAVEFVPYIASNNSSLSTFFNANPYVMTASCTEIKA